MPAGPAPKRFRPLHCSTDTSTDSSTDCAATPEDIQRHISELELEWQKQPQNRSMAHIKKLLKITRIDRINFLAEASCGISDLFKRYTCFESAVNVSNYPKACCFNC